MGEAVAFSLASKVLSAIASPALKMAYEKGVSIWEAKNELAKLQVSVETIQAGLHDAEKKQEGSDAIKKWIQRLKAVLYDVEDFFDEVLADELLKEHMMDEKKKLSLKSKVRICCSSLNPVVSRNSIAKKVKVIRGRLAEISNDMAQLGFVQGHPNDPSISTGSEKYTARCFIGEKYVIGRDEDKNVILKMLDTEPSNTAISDGPVVIAIDGIGGMGKTTLAHLIYNANKVKDMFNDNRWFACISDTTNEKEVLGKIYQSICGGSCSELNLFQIQKEIEGSIGGKKFLLVLDDVWEDDHGRWKSRKSMLSSGAKGSKIIVTTRFQSVVKALGAVGTHNLKGLSEKGSWDLFESLAFDSSYENDPTRQNVGRKLLQRCRGVPLAIWCMGSLLHNKTIHEWEDIERVGLPTVRGEHNDEIMSILKLSYNHLPSNLKQCFIYCSLFPKNYRYRKMELIGQWISLGYITIDEGESSFMHLLRMGFFQEEEDVLGEIESCKIHDILHDLAMYLGGEEIIVMNRTSLNVSSCARYARLLVDDEEDGLQDIPTSLLNVKSLRSFMLNGFPQNLDNLCSNYKVLRTLILSGLEIEHIPPSIGELKLVRYLNLSGNKFEELPDSITNLVNLMVLDISSCEKLKAWPHNFKKLIKLWSLAFWDCDKLWFMPEGIGEVACLQYLSEFKVVKQSDLDVLNGLLKQLRGRLSIVFREGMEIDDKLNWQLPADVSLQNLSIEHYPSQRIRGWGNTDCTSKLESLRLGFCKKVKYLPPLRFLPNLKLLIVTRLPELEFIEEEEVVNVRSNSTGNKLFFRFLDRLELEDLPKLKGWRGKVAAEATPTSSTSSASSYLEFPHLSKLDIKYCPKLESFPQCPSLQELKLEGGVSSTNLFSCTYPSLQKLYIYRCMILEKLHLTSPYLQSINIRVCHGLMSIELVGTHEQSLRYLDIYNCEQLKSLHIEEHLIAGLEKLYIEKCPELRLKLSKTKGKRLMVQQQQQQGCELKLIRVDAVLVEPLLPLLSPRKISIKYIDGIRRLHVPSPHLQDVSLQKCEELTSAEFEVATNICIEDCKKLKNFYIGQPDSLKSFEFNPLPSMVAGEDWDSVPNLNERSCIKELTLRGADGVFIERLLSSSSVFNNTGSLTVTPTSLECFSIMGVLDLKILNIQSQKLTNLVIAECSQLTNVSIVNPTALTDLALIACPKLRLSTVLDWDALAKLRRLFIRPFSPSEELPQCLLQRQALGHLQITTVEAELSDAEAARLLKNTAIAKRTC